MRPSGSADTMDRHDPLALTRRHFLSSAALSLGALGLSELLGPPAGAAGRRRTVDGGRKTENRGQPSSGFGPPSPLAPHFAPNAKRVIYLFQSGGPASQELFDYKPLLNEKHGEPLPEEVRGSQRLTGMSANQAVLPLAGSAFKFARHGK